VIGGKKEIYRDVRFFHGAIMYFLPSHHNLFHFTTVTKVHPLFLTMALIQHKIAHPLISHYTPNRFSLLPNATQVHFLFLMTTSHSRVANNFVHMQHKPSLSATRKHLYGEKGGQKH